MNKPALPQILAFDVFGTVVDWFGSIAAEFDRVPWGNPRPTISASDFALAWRDGYQPAMDRVRSGELGWTKIDVLHRMILDDLLKSIGQDKLLSEEQKRHLNRVWHRLAPWPDTVAGLTRLKRKFTIVTLSNGNLGLLCHMAKNAGLPWDMVLSAEVFHYYKPAPQTYLGVADVFDVPPAQVMLVAAHKDDLAAAAQCGLQTAFIERPAEFGPRGNDDLAVDPRFEYHGKNFLDLADQLGC